MAKGKARQGIIITIIIKAQHGKLLKRVWQKARQGITIIRIKGTAKIKEIKAWQITKKCYGKRLQQGTIIIIIKAQCGELPKKGMVKCKARHNNNNSQN